MGTQLWFLAQHLSPLPGYKLSEGRDALLQCGPEWSPAPLLAHGVFNKHFVFINVLTQCE